MEYTATVKNLLDKLAAEIGGSDSKKQEEFNIGLPQI
jgi:hypothetical protein